MQYLGRYAAERPSYFRKSGVRGARDRSRTREYGMCVGRPDFRAPAIPLRMNSV